MVVILHFIMITSTLIYIFGTTNIPDIVISQSI